MKQDTKRFGLGVFVCVFNRDFSKILLLKRNKEKREKCGAVWGNVGGRIEPGETSKEACLREIKEEIGLDLDSSKLRLLHIKETPNFSENIHALHFVYATILDERTDIKINHESDEYCWFNMKNLPRSMIDNRVDILDILKLVKNENPSL